MEPLKLKTAVKALWTDALRSGTFGQYKKKLADGEGNYCCLGVLSELAVQAGVIPPAVVEHIPPSEDEDGDGYDMVYYDKSFTVLPHSVAEWAFETLSDDPWFVSDWENPIVKVDNSGIQTSLAELNDGGHTFEEIAEIIREQL